MENTKDLETKMLEPTAIRLAKWLQDNYESDGIDEAAAELRRLHALCKEMLTFQPLGPYRTALLKSIDNC